MDQEKKELENNVEEVSKNPEVKKTKEEQKELEKFSKELVKRISKVNNLKPKKKDGFLGKVNPLIILVSIFLALFLFFGYFNFGTKNANSETMDFGELVIGIKNNQFSQITIKDDGSVVAQEKTYLITKQDTAISQAVNDNSSEDLKTFSDAQELSLKDFISLKKDKSLVDKIREFFGRKTSGLTQIILGEDYILGIEDGKDKNLYAVYDVTPSEFELYLKDNNIDFESDGIEITNLKVFGDVSTVESLQDRLQSEQINKLIQVDGTYIAELNEEDVKSYEVDWTPSIYSFTDTLIQQGIALDGGTFEIVTKKVPSSIGLSDILTVFTIITFIVLAVIIFKSAQASGMGIMQFGQSRARMFFGQKTNTTFKDVAGIDEAREELNEIVDFLKNPNKYRRLGARIPKGILMFGPPGTGKTLLARAIAGEAGVPFFHTSGSEFEEMLVGAGASRVRDLFAKAKKAAPALIFIDEIDAVARKRGTRIQSGSTEQTLNQILVEMDGFEQNTNVIVLAATNRPDVLDRAILRPGRFDRQVRIELPDKDGRLAILKIYAKNKPMAKDVNLERFAKRTVGFTGADLENILNEAAILAAKDNKREIDDSDVEEAISKVVLGPAKRSRKRTEDELKLVAYHEAGHALVAKMTPNSTPVDKISIVSRGESGGATMFLPDKDENIVSKGKLLADIVVSLGGRAAEEVTLNDISTGASNDIEKATQVAKSMIQSYGMNAELGLVQYGQTMDSKYLGYAYGDAKDYSEKTAEMIDEEVRKIISDAYSKAIKILKDNRIILDKLANLLLEKEVMEKDEFEGLFEKLAK